MNYKQKYLSAKPKPPIYHYTTQDGLIGIIKSKQLWATRIHYLNDSTEFSYATDILKNGIRNSTREVPINLKPIVQGLNDWIELVSRISIYVCSFSEEKDLLSQWRGYTQNGIGFSIGFDFEHIYPLLDKQKFTISQCIYDESTQYSIIQEMINIFVTNFLNSEKEPYKDRLYVYEEYYENFINDFIQIAPILKHPSYEEEKEWRLISKPISSDNMDVDYRAGASMLIPYYKLNLCEEGNTMLVHEIIVGPTQIPDLSRASVFDLLYSNKIRINSVSSSLIPYRPWI